MAVLDVENLYSLNQIEYSDFFHLFRRGSYLNLNSYKSNIERLGSFYEKIEKLDSLKNELESIHSRLNELTASFIDKKTVDDKYATKETLKNEKTALMTDEELENALEKFTNNDKVKEKVNNCKEEAHRYAAKITSEVLKVISTVDRSKVFIDPIKKLMEKFAEAEE